MPTGIDIFIVTNKAGASSSVGVSHDKTRLYVPVTLISQDMRWIVAEAKEDGEPLVYSGESEELLAHSDWVAKKIMDWSAYMDASVSPLRKMEALCNVLATMRLMMSNEPDNGKPQ